MPIDSDIQDLIDKEDELLSTDGRVERFGYSQTAYDNDNYEGATSYDPTLENNIPLANTEVLDINSTIEKDGFQTNSSSVPRQLINHFFGRVSYNLNKAHDRIKSFLTLIKNYLGQPNGIASLDSSGRIPYSQLPESAMEYKGLWDASTNTPELKNNGDASNVNGNFYIVSVEGIHNFGAEDIEFKEGDRVICTGSGASSVWSKLKSSVKWGEIDGNIADQTDLNSSFISIDQKATPNGIASLDSEGKLSVSQMPDITTDGMILVNQGSSWNWVKSSKTSITSGFKFAKNGNTIIGVKGLISGQNIQLQVYVSNDAGTTFTINTYTLKSVSSGRSVYHIAVDIGVANNNIYTCVVYSYEASDWDTVEGKVYKNNNFSTADYTFGTEQISSVPVSKVYVCKVSNSKIVFITSEGTLVNTGSSWTKNSQKPPTDAVICGYAGSYYYACSPSKIYYKSAESASWSSISLTNSFKKIAYNGTNYYAVQNSTTIKYANTIPTATWNSITVSNAVNDIQYYGSTIGLVAINNGGNAYIQRSTNGTSFTQSSIDNTPNADLIVNNSNEAIIFSQSYKYNYAQSESYIIQQQGVDITNKVKQALGIS